MENNCDSWCRTASGNTAKCTFKWTIQHFLERKEQRGEYIESTIFSVTGSDDKETKWFLEFFPKGRDLWVSESKVPHFRDSSWGENWVDKLRNNSNTLLPNGNLTILCKLEIVGEDKLYGGSKESFNKTQINYECQKQVINHLDNLFAEKNFADLEITCDDGEVFNCHRNILSARSPVFCAMFQANMIENHTQIVNIRDFKKGVLYEVPRFIYTGKVSSDDSLKKQAREQEISSLLPINTR